MLERFKIFDCTACNGDGNQVTNGENVRDGYNITECDTCEGTGLREYQLRNELLIAVKTRLKPGHDDSCRAIVGSDNETCTCGYDQLHNAMSAFEDFLND